MESLLRILFQSRKESARRECFVNLHYEAANVLVNLPCWRLKARRGDRLVAGDSKPVRSPRRGDRITAVGHLEIHKMNCKNK